MFRSIIDSWTSRNPSPPAAAAAAATTSPIATDEVTKKPNEDRLKDINFNHDYPLLFEDPITNTIMDTPVILNNNAAQTIDNSTLIQCRLAGNATCFVNPFNRQTDFKGIIQVHIPHTPEEIIKFTKKIEKLTKAGRAFYIENTSLKEHIDRFVQQLEQLNYLINQLNQLLCPIDDIASLFENTNPTLVSSVIEQQESERVTAISRTKEAIIDLLLQYIQNTEEVIEIHEDTEDQKRKYKKSLLTGPTYLQNLFIAELEQLAKLPTKDQYPIAIEKIDYYHDLIFTPLTDTLRDMAKIRIAKLCPSLMLHIPGVGLEVLEYQPETNAKSNADSISSPLAAAGLPANPSQASSSNFFSLPAASTYAFFNLAKSYFPSRAQEENHAECLQHDGSDGQIKRPSSPALRGADVD